MTDDDGHAWAMTHDEYEALLLSNLNDLTGENERLKAEIDELQQVARKSYMDLQREYMALEKKYHDFKEQYDIELARSASYQGALLMVTDKKPMPPWGVDDYMNSLKEES